MDKTSAWVCWTLAIVGFGVAPASAELLSCASIEELCIKAEVILEGEHLGDGRVRVIQVYKGADRLGDHPAEIWVEEVGRHSKRCGELLGARANAEVPQITASRVVVFLTSELRPYGWHESGSAGLFWYDEETCYGYEQFDSPGGYSLIPGNYWLQFGNADLKHSSRIPIHINVMRRRIELGLAHWLYWKQLLATKDPGKKARGLSEYLLCRTTPAGYTGGLEGEVCEELVKLKEDAFPVLVKVLKNMQPDDSLGSIPYLLRALYPFSPQSAIHDLRRMLKSKRRHIAVNAAEALVAVWDRESFEAIAALLPERVEPGKSDETKRLLRALYNLDIRRAMPFIDRLAGDPAVREFRQSIVPR
ncbi:MAG: hypothetical protein ACM359_01040 [Bacillota bacterium]